MTPTPTPDYDLRLGDCLATLDGETWDALICDPPYGARTHRGHNEMAAQIQSATGQTTFNAIRYSHWTPEDVASFVVWAAPRTRGWMVAFTSHDLIGAYEDAYHTAGRYPFAPVTVIQKRPRLIGDGPSNWTTYLMVSRPRNRAFATWGCLPGSYESGTEKLGIVTGAKPLDLMDAIVNDYSRPGDVVCDPTAGGATTLLAAVRAGRKALGSERDPDTHAKASARLSTARAMPLFDRPQTSLLETP